MSKPHLSWSQISQYLLCPRAYRYQRIDRLSAPGSPAAFVGKVAHSALEFNFRQKIDSGNDRKTDEVTDFFAEAWETNPELGTIRWTENPAGVHEGGVKALRAYMDRLAPQIQPAKVEERWEISLGDTFPFTLVVVLDLITVDNVILDNKFYSRMKSQADVDQDGQLDVYALAYRVMHKNIEGGLGLAIATRASTSRAEIIKTVRTNEQIRWRIGQIEDVAQAILAEVFPPQTETFKHNPKWCEYWGICQDMKSTSN